MGELIDEGEAGVNVKITVFPQAGLWVVKNGIEYGWVVIPISIVVIAFGLVLKLKVGLHTSVMTNAVVIVD